MRRRRVGEGRGGEREKGKSIHSCLFQEYSFF
jgi:hypothetical protein